MPYQNIVFVKLEKRLLNDYRWYTMSHLAQLLYLKLILLAAETYNKIPASVPLMKMAVRLDVPDETFAKALIEICNNFPKFKCKKGICSFQEFDHKTNWIAPKELPRNSQGTPKVVVDKEKKREEKEEDKEQDFFRFWSLYPKKKAKEKAFQAFKKLDIKNGLLEKILKAIEKQKHSDQWKKDNGQFIPFPATWLNGKRWEDQDGVTFAKKERTPKPDCDACSGSGKLPDGMICWCYQ